MNLEPGDERTRDGRTASAESVLRSAVEQAALLQIEMSIAIGEEMQRRLTMTDQEIAERLAEAERLATERIRQSVATAAELVLNARTAADRMAEELIATARADAELRLEEADRLCSKRLREAERKAWEMVNDSGEVSTPTTALAGSPDPPGGGEPVVDRSPSERAAEGDAARPVGPAPRRSRLLTKTFRIALIVVVSVVGSDLVRACVAEPYTVASTSMEPQLHDGNRLVVDKLAYRLGDVGRGDVVVVDIDAVSGSTHGVGGTLVKRVIGLPGDVVVAVDGVVSVNGQPLDEPWLHGVQTPSFGPVTLEPGTLFLLGDNRTVSVDSRTFGPVPVDAIVGRVDAVIWPLGDAGPV